MTATMTLDFKGVTETVELDRCNLLVGPNGSGKSARLEALQFAVQGDCRDGKRLEDVAKLGGPTGCGVVVTLNDGFAWRRYLRRDPKTGKLSMELNVVGHDNLSLRASESLLAERVGRFAPMFDLGEFLHLSDDKRRDFVLGLCGGADTFGSIDEVLFRIQLAYIVESIGAATVEVAAGKPISNVAYPADTLERKLLDRLAFDERVSLRSALAAIRPEIGIHPSITGAIAAALAKAKELANASRRCKDEAEQAGRKLSEQKAGMSVRAEALPELTKQHADLSEQMMQIREQIANQAGRGSARVALRAELGRIAYQIKQAQADCAAAHERDVPERDDGVELDRQATLIEESNPKPTFDDAELRARVAELHAAHRAALSRVQSCKDKIATLESRLTYERVSERRAEDDPWNRAHALFWRIDDEVGTFGNAEADWYSLKTLIDEQLSDGSNADWAAAIRKTEDELDAMRGTLSIAETIANEADGALSAAQDDVADANRKHAHAMEVYHSHARGAEHKRQDAERVREAIRRHDDELDRLEKRIAELDADRIAKERSLNELDQEAGVPVEQLRVSLDGLDEQAKALGVEIQNKRRFATLDEQLTRCIASAEREEVMHQVCKRLADAIRTLREELMHELVRPLIGRIDRFLSHASRQHRAYCELENDRGRPVLELGWTDGERRTPLPSMSGGETALFGAGLAYALVTMANPPLKLLLLEAAELDEARLAAVLDGLEAVSGDLDHVVVASCHVPALEHDLSEWDVHDLEDSGEESIESLTGQTRVAHAAH